MPASQNNDLRLRAFLFALAVLLTIGMGLAMRALLAAEETPPLAGEAADGPSPASTLASVATAPTRATPSATPRPTPTEPPPVEPSPTDSATATAETAITATAMAETTATATATATTAPTATPEPQPTPDGVVRRIRVPILMYHYLSAPPPGADAVRRSLSVSPETFAEHLRYLKEAGYETISLADLALALQIGHPLPERPIVITFDDGYRDNYTQAFPLLRAQGYTATFFLVTGPIDEGNEDYMSWDQVIEMHAAGMEFGAHSYTHPDLSGKDVDYIVWQTLGPRQAIEERIQEPVRFFCYPSGEYDDRVIRVLHSAHYWGAVTITAGVEHSSDAMFELDRVRVPGHLTAAGLDATLYGYMTTP